MRTVRRLNKQGQELPGWAYIVGMILGLFAIILLIWIAVKSGNAGAGQILKLKP
ncbi:MAG TPA: hypothetical protein VJJ82_04395 [Candidatus Nanoarchaeia archaeon]|nr:hypothetical protein [Candidatus Nanoarchaeia archaeon]